MAELSKTEIKEIKVEQNTIDDLNSDLAIVFETIENSFIIQANKALMLNSINGNYSEWKEKQKLNRIQLKKDVEKTKNNALKLIDNSLDEAFDKIQNIANLVALVKLPKEVKKDEKDIKKLVKKSLEMCVDTTMKNYDASVKTIYQMEKVKPLFDAIYKQTQIGIDKGLKIAYKDGRKMSFKSYMEMNVRTTLRQESNEYMFKMAKINKVVFYIASYFADCAVDHKDFQGKYYYDVNWKSFGYNDATKKKIQALINQYKMKSYQSVVEDEPYLTTRPNCRHQLRPVVLSDIEEKKPTQILNEYGINQETYHSANYKLLQRQRYNERKIRNYKTRLEEHQELYNINPNPKLLEQIKKDKSLVRGWQAIQTKLVNDHDFLKRDYRRESNKIIVNDLGAKYQLGLGFSGKMTNYKVKQ